MKYLLSLTDERYKNFIKAIELLRSTNEKPFETQRQ